MRCRRAATTFVFSTAFLAKYTVTPKGSLPKGWLRSTWNFAEGCFYKQAACWEAH